MEVLRNRMMFYSLSTFLVHLLVGALRNSLSCKFHNEWQDEHPNQKGGSKLSIHVFTG